MYQKLYIHHLTGVPTTAIDGAVVTSLRGILNTNLTIEVIFHNGLAEVQLDAAADGAFVLKPENAFGPTDPLLAVDLEWLSPVKAGTGYIFNVSMAGEGLAEVIGSQSTVNLSCMIAWEVAGQKKSTGVRSFVLENTLWHGPEAPLPSPTLPAPTHFKLKSPDGSVWELQMTDEGQLLRTKIV